MSKVAENFKGLNVGPATQNVGFVADKLSNIPSMEADNGIFNMKGSDLGNHFIQL